jgi:hypothetical protein
MKTTHAISADQNNQPIANDYLHCPINTCFDFFLANCYVQIERQKYLIKYIPGTVTLTSVILHAKGVHLLHFVCLYLSTSILLLFI